MLDAWRARGADRLDPVRFRFIEALDRRAAGYSGEARRILDDRLSGLLKTYADDLDSAALTAQAAPSGELARGALAGLVDYIASQAPEDCHSAIASNTRPLPSSYPDMEMLDYFRETWTRVSTEKQFRQSLAQVPGNAGPLNSSSLVHRSLSLMRELSPGYLQQFLSYADGLSWLEQLNSGLAPPEKDALRSGNARKSTRSKSR
jgi:hypothetical protein